VILLPGNGPTVLMRTVVHDCVAPIDEQSAGMPGVRRVTNAEHSTGSTSGRRHKRVGSNDKFSEAHKETSMRHGSKKTQDMFSLCWIFEQVIQSSCFCERTFLYAFGNSSCPLNQACVAPDLEAAEKLACRRPAVDGNTLWRNASAIQHSTSAAYANLYAL
jgi:hypothetical protein